MRAEAAAETLAAIERDPEAFVRSLDDPEGKGAPICLPDGSLVHRLPGFSSLDVGQGNSAARSACAGRRERLGPSADLSRAHRLCGEIPWKRGRGHAKAALAQMLPLASGQGLPYVHVTTLPDNVPSQCVHPSPTAACSWNGSCKPARTAAARRCAIAST